MYNKLLVEAIMGPIIRRVLVFFTLGALLGLLVASFVGCGQETLAREPMDMPSNIGAEANELRDYLSDRNASSEMVGKSIRKQRDDLTNYFTSRDITTEDVREYLTERNLTSEDLGRGYTTARSQVGSDANNARDYAYERGLRNIVHGDQHQHDTTETNIVGSSGPAGKDGKDSTAQGVKGDSGSNGQDSTVAGPPGPMGDRGSDGQSCSVSEAECGAVLTCGETSTFIHDGRNGSPGIAGADGTSCTTYPTEGGAVVQCGEAATFVANGETGATGTAGANGTAGTNGVDASVGPWSIDGIIDPCGNQSNVAFDEVLIRFHNGQIMAHYNGGAHAERLVLLTPGYYTTTQGSHECSFMVHGDLSVTW